MPDRLHFTDSDEANALIASDPLALLVGFALDQQVSVQKAFSGPLVIRERLGGSVLLGPREGPAGWRSVVETPAGGQIAFWQQKR